MKSRDIAVCAILGCAAVVLAALSVNFWYAQPAVDDFVFASLAEEKGVWAMVAERYVRWSGRYASDFLLALSYVSMPIIGYYWIPLLLNKVLLVAAIFFFVHTVTGAGHVHPNHTNGMSASRPVSAVHVTNLWTNTKLTILMLLLFIAVARTSSLFYWRPGVITYTVGLSLVLIHTSLVIRWNCKKRIPQWCYGVVLCFSFFVAGMNEGLTLLHLLVCGTGLVYAHSTKQNRLIWMVATGAAIIGMIVLVVAPGNQIRGSVLEDSTGTIPGVHTYVLRPTRADWSNVGSNILLLFRIVTGAWVKINAVVIALYSGIYLIPWGRKVVSGYSNAAHTLCAGLSTGLRVILLLCYAALPVAIILPAADILGGVGPHRSYSQAFFVMILGFPIAVRLLFSMVHSFGARVSRIRAGIATRWWRTVATLGGLGICVVWLAGLSFIDDSLYAPQSILGKIDNNFPGNAYLLIKDAVVIGPKYLQAYKERYRQIENIPGQERSTTHLTVDAINPIAPSIFFWDIGTQANNWRNTSTAYYFGLASIQSTQDVRSFWQ